MLLFAPYLRTSSPERQVQPDPNQQPVVIQKRWQQVVNKGFKLSTTPNFSILLKEQPNTAPGM